MANETTNTEVAVLVPELWRAEILDARYETMKAAQRALNVTGDVSGRGDILHIPIDDTFSVNDVGSSDGSTTNQTYDPTEAQLTVDKWKEVTADVLDKASIQAQHDFVSRLPRNFGRALGKQMETDLLALITSGNYSQAKGDGLGDVGEDECLAALEQLMQNEIPVFEMADDLTFVFDPKQYPVLKKIAAFTDASKMGSGPGGGMTLRLPSLYGITTVFSSVVVDSSSIHQNALFHKEALAWGQQQNIQVREFAKTKWSRVISASTLYGVKTVRANHLVRLPTKST